MCISVCMLAGLSMCVTGLLFAVWRYWEEKSPCWTRPELGSNYLRGLRRRRLLNKTLGHKAAEMDTHAGGIIHPDIKKEEERQGQLILAACKGACIELHVCPIEFVRGEWWRQKGRETERRELVSSCVFESEGASVSCGYALQTGKVPTESFWCLQSSRCKKCWVQDLHIPCQADVDGLREIKVTRCSTAEERMKRHELAIWGKITEVLSRIFTRCNTDDPPS